MRDRSHWGFGVYWRSLQRLNDPVGCGTLDARRVRRSAAASRLAASPCWRFQAVEDEWVDVDMTDVFGDWGCRWSTRSSALTAARLGTPTALAFDAVLDSAGDRHADV